MIKSKLSSKAQTTIPQAVRTALGLREGDEIAYKLDRDGVTITRLSAAPDDPFKTFGEWDTDADHRAYANL
jgi:antitoxin PrlF